jgi:hypothetical protein
MYLFDYSPRSGVVKLAGRRGKLQDEADPRTSVLHERKHTERAMASKEPS